MFATLTPNILTALFAKNITGQTKVAINNDPGYCDQIKTRKQLSIKNEIHHRILHASQSLTCIFPD